MSLMKSFVVLLIYSTTISCLNAQAVKTKIEKSHYKVNEEFTIEFKTDFDADSINSFSENGFVIVSRPNKSSNTSTINGKSTYSNQMLYVIKVLKPGKIEFQSPIYYTNGKAYQAKLFSIKITGDELTAEQLDNIEFESFVDRNCKSNGNIRIVFTNKMGFIEKYENDGWMLLRRLSVSEI